MAYVIPLTPLPAIAVSGTKDKFPVHRLYCVGRNYAEHSREMGHDPDRELPFFFQKFPDNILPAGPKDNAKFPYPPLSRNVHHEIELVAALGKGGSDVDVKKAMDMVWGYAVGIDMTRRDLQGEAKKTGRPWDIGKAFEHSAPMGPVYPASVVGHPQSGHIWLSVNGKIRQDGDVSQMIWKLPEIIAHLSTQFELKPGDLIFTGTPAGVGAVEKGDIIEGGVDGVGEIKLTVV